MYCKFVLGRLAEKDPSPGGNRFSEFAQTKKFRIANPSKNCNAVKFSQSIFSYDGTDRIRFTGRGTVSAKSQPESSGTPKMELFCG